MQTLPHEQFEYQKTLAEIGVQIAKGRAEIAEIAQKKEAFIQERTAEVLKRVASVITASENALNLAHANQNLLENYQSELQNFALELYSWKEKLSAQQQDFDLKNADFQAKMKVTVAEFEKISNTLKVQQTTIDSDRQQNYKRTVELTEQERMVNDKYQTLLRTQKRI